VAKSRANSSGERRSRGGDLPSAAELLAFIRESPSAVGKREIARAFAVAPGNRPELRDMLRNIERSGAVARAANRRFVAAPPLPEVTAIERIGSDEDGLALARPVAWPGPEPAPILRIV
jgi:ribonuclease R